MVHSQQDINDVFCNCYSVFNSVPTHIDDSLIDNFLEGLPYPQLTADAQKSLSGPITRMEIKAAIKGLPRNKAPGLDSLPIEFFDSYSEAFIP